MDKHEMDDNNYEAMVDTIRCRREDGGDEPAQYTAPGAEKRWRARDLVDIHWKLTGTETPSESYSRIMSCIVGHANPNNGICNPRQSVIAIETGYSRDTIKRAIDWWTVRGFLKTESRGLGRALAYHPQWDLFELHWVAVADDIAAAKESRAASRCGTRAASRGGTVEPHHGATQNLKGGTSKMESHPEWAPSPSALDATALKEEKIGIQKEGFVSDSASPQPPPAKPIDLKWWAERVAKAEAELQLATSPQQREAVDAQIERLKARMKGLENEQSQETVSRAE